MPRLTDTGRRTATATAFTLAGAVAILLGIGGVVVGILGIVRGGGYGAVVWLTLVGVMMAFGIMLLYVGRARRIADRGSAGPREPAA
jgi:hypothetical protein